MMLTSRHTPFSKPLSRSYAPTVNRTLRLRCRAEQDTPASPKPAVEASPTPGDHVETKQAQLSAPLLRKGQGTAIVTGAISAILGLGYLVLVWLIDSRGGQLQPPPPEAFLP
ncbi:hypothetical protein Agub_g8477 [Astrephomene gubernaculifera]|uniref:Uncharacterized protein n=1 Tax=Astrephomene gubernaculifera TaxID=47775 RepID=A0AAD3DTH1_9CHLO|nr:hypothetical protein Agub_g8477 [Astrephomene gubernaculifera]